MSFLYNLLCFVPVTLQTGEHGGIAMYSVWNIYIVDFIDEQRDNFEHYTSFLRISAINFFNVQIFHNTAEPSAWLYIAFIFG